MAAGHLDRRLSRRFDAEDVVQSVFRTFCRRRRQGELNIDGSVHLWRLLVRITILKARARARQHTANTRDVRAETPSDPNQHRAENHHEPNEQAAVDLFDLMETVLQGFPAWYADALQLRLQGHSVAEVATEVERSQQSVYRALHVLHNRFSTELT